MRFCSDFALSLSLIVNSCHDRAVFLVLEDRALRATAKMFGACSVNYLSIASRANVLASCIEN